jgi:hypothetical protein
MPAGNKKYDPELFYDIEAILGERVVNGRVSR